jgi:hypothetical protein
LTCDLLEVGGAVFSVGKKKRGVKEEANSNKEERGKDERCDKEELH